MKTVKAFIERGNDGNYGIYVDLEDTTLNFGIHGNGSTPKEAIDDFVSGYESMKEFYNEKGKEFIEAKFHYVYDVASFLSYYNRILSLAGLEKITGINQGQLSHYVTGKRKPSKITVEKIERNLHNFAKELNQVEFV